MPNWVKNTVTMRDITKKDIFRIDDDGKKQFDFQKFVPQPSSKEECIEKYGEQFVNHDETPKSAKDDKPWFNRCEWCCHYWGTFSIAFDTKIVDDDTITFLTKETEPIRIWEALSIMSPEDTLSIMAEYELGFTCLRTVINGEETSHEEREGSSLAWTFE